MAQDKAPSAHPRIFIVGSERSGTNLLRTLLDNHSMLGSPVAPHFFDAWRGNLKPYGDLRIPENAMQLAEDMLEYANHPFNDWGLELDIPGAFAQHTPRSFWEIFDLLYLAKSGMHGKSGYACKGNHIFNYAFQVKAAWPGAKFLYLFRDPRDHCASWKQKPMHLKTVWDSVSKWEREQRQCLDLVKTHGIDMHFVSYEDLIADTPRIMAGALQHCGLPVEEACFQTDAVKNHDTAKRLVYWENLDKPIIRDNMRKYVKVLTPDEVELVETKAGSLMDELGYACETGRNWIMPRGHRYRIRLERYLVGKRFRDHLAKELGLLYSKQAMRTDIRERAIKRGPRK